VGLQGALAFTVARRTREIGIRLALGASPRDILTLVCRQGAGPVALGLGAGAIAAVALTRSMASLLYGVAPTDPPTLIGAVLVLAAVAAVATSIPARRASRIHPMTALREE
jgi:ABC-type antimicrobial peptide transport system permease subunit